MSVGKISWKDGETHKQTECVGYPWQHYEWQPPDPVVQILGGKRIHEQEEDRTKNTHLTPCIGHNTLLNHWGYVSCHRRRQLWPTPQLRAIQIQDKQYPGWLTAKPSCNSHNISQLIQASDLQEVNDRVCVKSCVRTRSWLSLFNNPKIRQIAFIFKVAHSLMIMVQNHIPSCCCCCSQLWLEKLHWMPTNEKMLHSHDDTIAQDNGCPSQRRNRGPEASPLNDSYLQENEVHKWGWPLYLCGWSSHCQRDLFLRPWMSATPR